jgi:hypothetical protein
VPNHHRSTLFALLGVGVLWGGGSSGLAAGGSLIDGWQDPATGIVLAVHATDRHPFLGDHGRVLCIEPPGANVRTLPLCASSSGIGVANVYRRVDGGLFVVDMDGNWIELAANGDVVDVRWRYGEPLPATGLGSFQSKRAGRYAFDAALVGAIDLIKAPRGEWPGATGLR